MKITDVSIDSFGHWKGLHLPDLSARVTVIYGPNEAGKSTLLHLMRGIFYGFSVRHHARFVPPRFPGSCGGQLTVNSPNGRFRLRRTLPLTGPLRHDTEGDLQVQATDGAPRGKHTLNTLLHGVDEAIFRNVFAVGLTEMQQLGTLSDTQAAQQLYGLAAGADRVSISEVATQLDDALVRRLRPQEAGSLFAGLEALSTPVARDESPQVQRWLRVMDELRQLQTQLEQLEHSLTRYRPAIRQAPLRAATRELWKNAKKLHQRIEQLGPLTKIPTETLTRLKQGAQQIGQLRKQWEKIRQRRRQLQDQARQLVGSPALLHHAEPILALHQRSARLGSLAQEIDQLKVKIDETEFEMQAELERIGIKATWRPDAFPTITNELIDALREPARICREARERAEAIEQEEQAARAALDQLQVRLSIQLKGTTFVDLGSALKRGEQQVRGLRQRVDLAHRLESAGRDSDELREESHAWTRRQLIPWRGLIMLGMVFSLGALLLLLACFGDTFQIMSDQRGTLAVLGGVVSVFALGAKGMYEVAAGRSAATCRDELTKLKKQMQSQRDELQRIDQQLGPSAEPWHIRLQKAEEEWDQLSELQPFEAQRQAAQQRIDKALADKEVAAQALKEGRQRWRDALHQANLPESITPAQFRQMSQGDSPITALRWKLAEYQEQHLLKKSELQEIQQKVQGLLERANLHETSDRLGEQIEQLRKSLQQARETHQQRESLHRQWRDAGREQERLAQEAKRARQRRHDLVHRFGVRDSRELRTIIQRQQEAQRLRQRRDRVLKQLTEQLGPLTSLADLQKELKRGKFDQRLRSWEADFDRTSQQLAEMQERRQGIQQQLKVLSGQRDHLLAQIPRGAQQTQWRAQAKQWLVLAGIRAAIDQVRKSYESERQPETLAEASSYLTHLTQGKYQRIWTPFGESALCVDDQQGRGVRVEHLSRGTREQVFLSLRLALAAEYSRRGAALPLILDDVFVNFDAQRARAAAETVCRFAEAGHQVLVFTCHEHIRDVFHSLGVDLRILPSAAQLAESPEPVLPWTEPWRPAPVSPPPLPPALPETAESAPLPPLPPLHEDPTPAPDDLDEGLEAELTWGPPPRAERVRRVVTLDPPATAIEKPKVAKSPKKAQPAPPPAVVASAPPVEPAIAHERALDVQDLIDDEDPLAWEWEAFERPRGAIREQSSHPGGWHPVDYEAYVPRERRGELDGWGERL